MLRAVLTALTLAAMAAVVVGGSIAGGGGDSHAPAVPVSPPFWSLAALTRAAGTLRAPDQLAPATPRALAAATAYARARRGRVAFAVGEPGPLVDGLAPDQPFSSASLSKATLLVAALRRSGAETNRLDAMIRVSDNLAARRVFRTIGRPPVREVARLAGLRSFRIGPDWAHMRLTPADQARLFLSLDELLPWQGRRRYARFLLSHISASQSWGIPQVARPRGWRVYFKGGWRPGRSGYVVHQAALLERGGRRLALAVLSDRNPSEAYGRVTVAGIATRLLRGK